MPSIAVTLKQCKTISFATLIALVANTTAPGWEIAALTQSLLVTKQTTQSQKEEAHRLIEEGNKQFATSQFRAALRSYQQALRIYQGLKDRQGEGYAFNGLGHAYGALGDYKQAITYLQQSLNIVRQIGDKEGEGIALGNLGLAYYSLGDYKQAITYHQQFLNIARQIGDKNGEGRALGNLGLAYYSLGDYKQAITYHQQFLNIARQIGDKNGEGIALGNLGLAYYSLGDYKQAITYHQQFLNIARQIGDKNGEGIALGNLGLAYYSLGDYKQAITYHQQFLNIARQIGDKQGEGRALGNLGLAYGALGDYKQAITYHQQFLNIARQIGDKNGEGRALGNLGLVYGALGDYKQAITYLQQFLNIARQIGDKQGEGIALNYLGLALLSSGKPEAAAKFLKTGIESHESLRALLGERDAFKVSIFETQSQTYRLLQQALIAQGQTEQALEIAERGRARAFVELLAQRQESATSTPPTIRQIQQIARQQNATLVNYSIVWNELYIWVIQPSGKVAFHRVSLKGRDLASGAEDARTAAATIAVGRGRASDAVADLVRSTRAALDRSNHTATATPTDTVRSLGCRGNKYLQQMYQLLIEPIAAELPADPNSRIIFIPHESLFLVPFAALLDKQEKFLIEKHTLSIAPSIQVSQLTRQQRLKLQQSALIKLVASAPSASAVVVGNPIMPKVPLRVGEQPQPLEPLVGAETEAKAIAQLLNVPAWVGKQATETAVVQQMVRARTIHLATHGLLEELGEAGIPGAVALAPDGKNDGLLRADEVVNLNLAAQLVVLSACDTGRGRIAGDGVIGLPRAFITAGTPSIVVSLWRVGDEPTAFLMPEFYRQLGRKRDKASALRQAMLATMKKYPNPNDWAAFLLIGESQ